MRRFIAQAGSIFTKAGRDFVEDECPRMAAALAYYSIFSLPALLVLLVSLASLVADRESVVERLSYYLRQSMGTRAAEQMAELIGPSLQSMPLGWASVIGGAMLLLSASSVLAEVQTALNRAWEVEPDPKTNWLKDMFGKRLLSLGMIFGVAVLLLVSLVFSWALAAISAVAENQASFVPTLLKWADQGLSLIILTAVFATLYRYLPDVKLHWADVWTGAALTSFLFVLGKVGLGFYLAWSDPTTAFGAAGSLALVLLWIYYTSMIFLFGGEFTQAYYQWRHGGAKPSAA